MNCFDNEIILGKVAIARFYRLLRLVYTSDGVEVAVVIVAKKKLLKIKESRKLD